MIVSGQIHVPRGELARTTKVVWIRVLDVSRADASSETVAEQRLRDVEIQAGDGVEAIPFYLDKVGGQDPRADLNVAVHVNWSGSGDIEKGDYLTTRSYPIDPSRDVRDVIIKVQQV